jgi:hypothetical protein
MELTAYRLVTKEGKQVVPECRTLDGWRIYAKQNNGIVWRGGGQWRYDEDETGNRYLLNKVK